jgi:hypothetical protein
LIVSDRTVGQSVATLIPVDQLHQQNLKPLVAVIKVVRPFVYRNFIHFRPILTNQGVLPRFVKWLFVKHHFVKCCFVKCCFVKWLFVKKPFVQNTSLSNNVLSNNIKFLLWPWFRP